MENRIQLAFDNGYKIIDFPGKDIKVLRIENSIIHLRSIEGIEAFGAIQIFFLDPLFWQALVRADGIPPEYEKNEVEQFIKDRAVFMNHSLVTHLHSGKDVNSFFNN